MITVPADALNIIKTLKTAGFAAYLVGGCVRDSLLGLPVEEWDITTSAKPQEVTALFPKVVPTGLEYGTVTILTAGGQYEVTTFRADEKYVDGRHPLNVVFTGDLHQDLARRDFTINAIAYDPTDKTLIDDWQGEADLTGRSIKAIGDPIARFSEDGLRSIRACRFAAKLGFKIDGQTFAAIPATLEVTKKVAAERLHDELVKILKTPLPSVALELMRLSGLLNLVLPELVACYKVEQPPEYHKYDVYWHNLYACDAAPVDNYLVRLAALLHDIGKPPCQSGMTFYNHDKTGEEMARTALARLKFSNKETDKVAELVSHHMFDYNSGWSDAAVRRFIRRIGGVENLPDLFALRRADAAAMIKTNDGTYLNELQNRIDKIVAEQNALKIADLKVGGNDVMAILKIKPGPKVGEVLNALLEKVLDDPNLNEREKLIGLIKGHA